MALFGAIDLGASSGRVIAGVLKDGRLSISEVHRFENRVIQERDRLTWDFDHLMTQIRRGIRELGARAERLGIDVTSVGVDTWAVDYGLIRSGELLSNPNCYRDPLNQFGVERVHDLVDFKSLYGVSGIQFLPFNSIYQLVRQQNLENEISRVSEHVLLVPDLIGYQLTGNMATERTNASSTGLLDAQSRNWSHGLAMKVGLDISKFPQLRDAGDVLGPLRPGFGRRLAGTNVVLVGSHDTASAVVAVPAEDQDFAYLSSGTWSLLGTELDAPVLSDEARAANFTNELGVDGKVRFLKNLSGLWLLSESVRTWQSSGLKINLRDLISEAAQYTPNVEIDVTDPNLLAPGDMPSRIARQLSLAGQQAPTNPAEMAAVILHSLAKSYARSLVKLRDLTGKSLPKLHIIGGGVQNQLLCQLTADYCNVEVQAGPVEATAIGNILVQARAAGRTGPSLSDIRSVVRQSDFQMRTYIPTERFVASWQN
jgi:rhamnulokinase